MGRWTANSRRRAAIVGLGVLLLHAALWWLLGDARQRATPPAGATRMTLRLVPLAPPTPQVLEPPSVPLPHAATPRPTTRAARSTPARPAPITVTASPAEPEHASTALTAITPPSPAASDAAPALLDTDASRRAIRSSARAPWLGDQLARSREEPARVGPNERLANGVREAGKGDCLKGEYAGAGMGLLSVPFLALAAASGNCAK